MSNIISRTSDHSNMSKKHPLVVVLGATACGKSKLAIELAQKFDGEIISADSMQVYQGLDIVTNKVTEEELLQAKHHMIGIIKPLHRYTVIDFKRTALDIINDLHRGNKLPIIVGGTNYYIESLIWDSFIMGSTIDELENKGIKRNSDDSKKCDESTGDIEQETVFDKEDRLMKHSSEECLHNENDLENIEAFFSKHIYTVSLTNIKSEKLWNILEKVDPKTAYLFHPNDRRRIIRSLQIYQQKRETYSNIIESINAIDGQNDRSSSLGGLLRFDNTRVIWLDFPKDELNKILDDRVDAMLNRGLLAELESFYKTYAEQQLEANQDVTYSQGIFQTIGFKEFHKYFLLDEDVRATEEGNKLLRQSIDAMKLATRQYARRQLKWINRRFTFASSRVLPKLYKLNSSFDETIWCNQVQGPAFEIVQAMVDDNFQLSDQVKLYEVIPKQDAVINEPGKFHCEPCDRLFIGRNQIESHLASKGHKKMTKLWDNKKQALQLDGHDDQPQRTENQ